MGKTLCQIIDEQIITRANMVTEMVKDLRKNPDNKFRAEHLEAIKVQLDELRVMQEHLDDENFDCWLEYRIVNLDHAIELLREVCNHSGLTYGECSQANENFLHLLDRVQIGRIIQGAKRKEEEEKGRA